MIAESDPELQEIQRLGEYLRVRRLPDGSVAALGDLLFTRAIHLRCDLFGWERRFCFQDKARADAEFAKLQTEDDEPTGWIARRPEVRAQSAS